jgi:hypothetical protein
MEAVFTPIKEVVCNVDATAGNAEQAETQQTAGQQIIFEQSPREYEGSEYQKIFGPVRRPCADQQGGWLSFGDRLA